MSEHIQGNNFRYRVDYTRHSGWVLNKKEHSNS